MISDVEYIFMYQLSICMSLEKNSSEVLRSFLSFRSHKLSTNPVGSTLKLYPWFDYISPSHPGLATIHLLPGFCSSLLIIISFSISAHSLHSSQSDPAKTKTHHITPQLETLLWHHTEKSQVLSKPYKTYLVCVPTQSLTSSPTLPPAPCFSHQEWVSLLGFCTCCSFLCSDHLKGTLP